MFYSVFYMYFFKIEISHLEPVVDDVKVVMLTDSLSEEKIFFAGELYIMLMSLCSDLVGQVNSIIQMG